MKHGPNPGSDVPRETPENPIEPDVLANWLGIGLDAFQRQQLDRYAEWLCSEALEAGGIGPSEVPRIWDRHVLDALAYVRGVPPGARTVLDVGGGVGLPGIPMAIALPAMTVTILDRSERRTHLAKRAVRILGLDNTVVITGDVHRQSAAELDVAAFRASLTVEAAAEVLPSLVGPDGVGLFGLSRQDTADAPRVSRPGVSLDLSNEAGPVLDSPFWLLTMRVVDVDAASRPEHK